MSDFAVAAPPPGRPTLEFVLAEYLRRIDRGEAVDRDQLVAEHPEIAAELKAFFDDSDEVDRFADMALGLRPDDRDANAWHSSAEGTWFGDYELLREIGRGGMGVIYLARQSGLNRLVGVKLLLEGRMAGAIEVGRFRAEAEAAAGLRHPNIVAIHEVGCHDGQHFFSMEYVEGRTLAEVVREGPIPADRASGYLRIVAEAIEHAHREGILHRDLKPSNVLIDAEDRPRITDFGLARRTDGLGGLTLSGAIVGTPSYMSPEQADGDRNAVGRASDVYSLGAMLYELITGRPPFQAESPLETLWLVRRAEPVRPRLLNPKIPVDLETIALTCLEKDPSQRYPSARALADELGRFLRREPIHARPIGRARRGARWCRRNPALAGLIAASITLAALASSFAAQMYRALERTTIAAADLRRANRLENDQRRLALHERDAAQGHLYVARVQMARQAYQSADIPGMEAYLAAAKPTRGEADRRGWEWYFLQGLARQDRITLAGHAGPVRALAWSGDGGELATGGEDRILRLWDTATGRLVRSLEGHAEAILALSWSRDGTRIASAGRDETIRVWDAATGRLLHRLPVPPGGVRALAWDRDGQRLGAAVGPDILICDPPAARVLATLRGHTEFVSSLAWSPDESRMVSGGDDRTVRVWDVSSSKPIHRLNGHTGWVNAVAWAPEGDHVASVGQDGTLRLWDAATGSAVAVRLGAEGAAYLALSWSPDGRSLLTTGSDRGLTLWNAAELHRIRTLRGHRATVRLAAWSPNRSQLASADDEGTVKLWSATAQADGTQTLAGSAPVKSVAWSPNGSRLAASDLDGIIRLWDPTSGRLLRALETPYGRGKAPSWDRSGHRLAVAQDEQILLWNVGPGAEAAAPLVLGGHDGPVWCVAWDPTGRSLASAGGDAAILIREGGSGRVVRTIPDPGGQVRLLCWSPDGRLLASAGTAEEIHLWDVATGRLGRTLASPRAGLNDLAFRPDGDVLAAACGDGLIRLWEVPSGDELPSLAGHHGAVWSVAWSPNSQRLVSAGHDSTVKLWDQASGQEALVLRGHHGAVWSVAWSPDGRKIASAGVDQTVRVWDASPGYETDRSQR